MISIDAKAQEPNVAIDEVVITLDEEGLSSLMAQLNFLVERRTDHLDLMSPSWGGNHLSGVPSLPRGLPIHYLKIMLVGKDGKCDSQPT